MSVPDDIADRIAAVKARYGNGDELADIGGWRPEVSESLYMIRLASIRKGIAEFRADGKLGWNLLLEEELLEAFTADNNADRYDELMDLIAAATLWAEAIRRRQN